MTLHNTHTYIDVLPKLSYNYNHTFHSGIKGEPAKPDLDLIKNISDENYRNAQMTETKFKIGNKVRYRLKKKIFEKGSNPSWSKTIHKVIAVIEHSYILDNSKRYLYYDLQRV